MHELGTLAALLVVMQEIDRLAVRGLHRFRIVVALDMSEYAEIVLEHAVDQAMQHPAPDLHFVTVVKSAKDDLDDVKAKLAALVLPSLDRATADWRARLHVRAGRPHEEIACFAADVRAQMIVLGRFGLHHPGKRLGSVASRVIDSASCPTLVVGFGEDAPDARDQCPDCVSVRAESDGERWFCAAHAAPDRISIATTIVPSGAWGGGSLMW